MKINEFYKMIQKKPIILDGATGSNLQKAGMKPGVCPEEWILENEYFICADFFGKPH